MTGAARLQVAKNNEVMVAISNSNYAGKGNMLDTWMQNVKRAGVSNAMVVALDLETQQHALSEGFASLVMTLQAWPPPPTSSTAPLQSGNFGRASRSR